MLMINKTKAGFSLIELLIAIVIIGILAGIALPSYQYFVTKARRSDGKVAVMDLAGKLEQYYGQNGHTYAGATLTNLGVNAATPEGYYNLSLGNLSATTYTIQAQPVGTQANDAQCATFTYNQLGQKGITGTSTVANCW